ncbi:tetratricopeptide repeat protein [Elizabethkingia sp. JS20170427COW]|uniref:tetratricopeptide repeat protein n=1 Tax=Elizabethkingia sp. JS20170427COW TaxID=2583851 RepID=UPI0011101D51|nr:tetratricopeptide repeat protein [Elizabethkingia sp. JS20170427COW]QCX53111.1 tetratricopeptide repeat protein [Elizabethkingia sp. JS20170427COW]
MEEFFENEAVKRFEEMLENNEELFFDLEEYDDIISYYLEIGDYQYADTAIRYALKLYPNAPEIKVRKLELHLEKNENIQAKSLMDELKGLADENLDYHICCAKYYSNMGKSYKAIEICERALDFEEDQDFLHNFIADEFQILGDPFMALKHYKLALKYEPNEEYSLQSVISCLVALNKTTEAIEFVNGYLDNNPYSQIAWMEYGNIYYNQKNYKEAIKAFDYLLAINAEAIGVYSNKAACYEALEEWEEAIKTYQESQEYEFTKAYSYHKIGLCYRKLNQPTNALNAMQKALYEDPQFHQAMISISEVYEELGNLNEAVHFAVEATKYNENNLDLQKKLAFLYISLGKFEEALVCLKRMVDCEPHRFYHWYAYTEVLMLIGEYEKAESTLMSGLKEHPRAELYYQLSNCYFNLKKDNEARAALDQAIRLNPSLIEDMQQKYPYIDKEIKKVKSKRL